MSSIEYPNAVRPLRIAEAKRELINADGVCVGRLFSHPNTKIEFVQKELGVSRLTATRYLDPLVSSGFLLKRKIGRFSYYINEPLFDILTGPAMTATER